MSESTPRRQTSELPGSLRPLLLEEPSSGNRTVEGYNPERLPQPIYGQDANANITNAGNRLSCQYTGHPTSTYFPLNSSSSIEDRALRSAFDVEKTDEDDEPDLSSKPRSSQYSPSFKTSWQYDLQPSSSSQLYSQTIPYPSFVPIVPSDYASSSNVLNSAAYEAREYDYALLTSAASSSTSGTVPHALSHERHNRHDFGVGTSSEVPRESRSRTESYYTRPQPTDYHSHRFTFLPIEHERRPSLPPFHTSYRFSPTQFPPLNGQQWRGVEESPRFPSLAPFHDDKHLSKEIDLHPYAATPKRASTYPYGNFDLRRRNVEIPSVELPRPTSPPHHPGESDEQTCEDDLQAQAEEERLQPVQAKRIAGPSRANKRKPIPESVGLDDEDEDTPKKVPRKTLIACGFCRRRKLKCDGRRPMCGHCLRRTELCAYAAFPRRRGPGKAPKGSKKVAKARASRKLDVPPGAVVPEFSFKFPGSPLAGTGNTLPTPGPHHYSVKDGTSLTNLNGLSVREPAQGRTEREGLDEGVLDEGVQGVGDVPVVESLECPVVGEGEDGQSYGESGMEDGGCSFTPATQGFKPLGDL